MQLVPQVVRTERPTMTVVDTEEGALWPILAVLVSWFDYVKDYRNSVFIIVSDYTLVCVGSVGLDHAVSFCGALCWLVVGENDISNLLKTFL